MESEFDREMDALLRQSARGETAPVDSKFEIQDPKSHLDADQISLFAENALSEKTKAVYIEHFAGCDRCRKILSNVISLDAENSRETVYAPQKATIAATLPWYKRLFAVPNSAYATGALLLVFAGLAALMFLKSPNDSKNTEIARQVEPIQKMSGPNAGGGAQTSESNAAAMSNAASMSPNSAMSNLGAGATNAASATNRAAISATNAAGSMSRGAPVSNSVSIANKQTDKKNETAKSQAQSLAESVIAGNDKTASETGGASIDGQKNQVSDNARTRPAAETIEPDAPKPAAPMTTSSAPAELPVNGRTTSALGNSIKRKSKSAAPETRAAGGRTFKRENGVWYDSAYGGQATTNVRRDSADYKKLASGLRSIAESLSGAIVVVFDGKAYRIQ